MVACSGKGSPFAVFRLKQFLSLLHVTAKTLRSLAVTVYKLQTEIAPMIYSFLFYGTKRPKISIPANSETEARQKLNLSKNYLCIARYSDAFIAQKTAKNIASYTQQGGIYA